MNGDTGEAIVRDRVWGDENLNDNKVAKDCETWDINEKKEKAENSGTFGGAVDLLENRWIKRLCDKATV